MGNLQAKETQIRNDITQLSDDRATSADTQAPAAVMQAPAWLADLQAPVRNTQSSPAEALKSRCFESSIWDMMPSQAPPSDTPDLGVPHAELCLLASAIQVSLANLAASAATARDTLGQRYSAALSDDADSIADVRIALDSERDALLAAIDAAEAGKAAALDREAVRVDAALEALMEVCGAAWSTLQALSSPRTNAEVEAAGDVSLMERPRALEEAEVEAVLLRAQTLFSDMLCVLPRAPCEPAFISLTSPSDGTGRLGRVVAPLGLTPADVVFDFPPTSVLPGFALEATVRLSKVYIASIFEDAGAIRAAVASLASGLVVSAALTGTASRTHATAASAGSSSDPPLELPLSVSIMISSPTADDPASSSGGVLLVSIEIPAGIPIEGDFAVTIKTYSVAGVSASPELCPYPVPLCPGIHAPLRLPVDRLDRGTPVVSPADGSLFVPRPDLTTLRFSAHGELLGEITPHDFGLSEHTTSAAATRNAVFLADDNTRGSVLVALSFASLSGRHGEPSRPPTQLWRAKGLDRCRGLAVLPAHGAVFASSFNPDEINVYDVETGKLLTSTRMVGPVYLAADELSSCIYMSGTSSYIQELQYSEATLESTRAVDSAGESSKYRPLTVMPPSPGRRTAFLIAGENDSPELCVIRLPDLVKVHEHHLGGINVRGLAADPSGRALVVCDGRADEVHVLPWPLPGMRASELS